ncbi:endoplasmic reticulum metallopeptidase 1-like isoform X2 [Macrosteles quadrilineatus]|uniref:endoplasmic reticulum metallopeptidase 1-like isoform X2 n=1 Tax=Macrosteles quadrilineatus TaxID=74068 RepID=UPI0023E0D0DF|nr:endoplasmic reticulum metallopeptidase 1-like isoform X2 [Macrosteles quadrilineatus]
MLRQRAKTSGDEEWPPPPPPIMDEKATACTSRLHRLSTTGTVVAVVSVTSLIYIIALLLNNRLPLPLNISDETFNADRFIAERARSILEELSDLGPKVAGSFVNEVHAVHFLQLQINNTILQANPIHKISQDIQKPTGSFSIPHKSYKMVYHYNGIQNIIVKIGPHSAVNGSLLVNCHFDSVPLSPGASDDGLNCAVMLEVLRVISRQRDPLQQNIIFLFNGAEETPLMASHGFITTHKWAPEVRAFINLESCGAGGKEVLFQAGPNHPWLVQLYAESVPFPSAKVLFEEIFHSGLIPSDTDFRIFRDYGQKPGLDFAHCKNGYVYHTKYDRHDMILPSVYQHTGDNLLALVRHIVASEQIKRPNEFKNGRQVYFDVLGLFMVQYSEVIGIILNLSTVALSVYTVIKNTLAYTSGMKRQAMCRQLALSVLVPALGMVLAVTSAVANAIVLDSTQRPMSWYTHNSLVLPIYFLPSLFALSAPLYIFTACKSSKLCDGIQAQMYCNGIQLIWSVLLLIATVAGIRSAYILMIVVLIPAVANFLLLLCQRNQSVPVWLCGFLASALLPAFYTVYLSILFLQVFVPVTGRLGADTNPDIIIGVICSVLCVLIASYFVPLMVLIRKPWTVFLSLIFLYVAGVLTAMYTSVGFPYLNTPSSPTPQRLYVVHSDQTYYGSSGFVRKRESGFYVMNLDRRINEIDNVMSEMTEAQDIAAMCEEIFCGIPVISWKFMLNKESKNVRWLKAGPPAIYEKTGLEFAGYETISKVDAPHLVRRVHFNVSGPDHMHLIVWPKVGVKLVGWSFNESGKDPPTPTATWDTRPAYVVSCVRGLHTTLSPVYFDLQSEGEVQVPLAAFVAIGQYLHDERQFTMEMKTFLSKFPSWSHVTPWFSQTVQREY